ncbi:MAG TPA: hypothetical protein VLG37_04055 [Candidatus Saccharimonadales bacterium]|nr:hypothetical protein [Candidatus Saccharimonadales bacterium]
MVKLIGEALNQASWREVIQAQKLRMLTEVGFDKTILEKGAITIDLIRRSEFSEDGAAHVIITPDDMVRIETGFEVRQVHRDTYYFEGEDFVVLHKSSSEAEKVTEKDVPFLLAALNQGAVLHMSVKVDVMSSSLPAS